MMFNLRYCRRLACYLATILTAWCVASPSSAATFSARVSPPNFELKAKPGQNLREVVEIQNDSKDRGEFEIRTADWELDSNGGVVIRPPELALPASSCRSWTRIERPKLKLAGGATKRYRFEVQVPQGAPDGECRFAILIGPTPENVDTAQVGDISFPVAGQIAVIVYVTIGDAKPVLDYKGVRIAERNGVPTPVVALHNSGNAHGRPFGSVVAKDAGGQVQELLVVPFPILPGGTTDIVLQRQDYGKDNADDTGLILSPPVSLKGLIEWDGGTYKLDTIAQ